ncbi:MAG TPA: outer membrane protein assembly factor BamE [Mariprofundaceae bacterium]|nr:outer membrane protein assembly factor BamE [Mariprofundaceae bacterium]
MNIRYIALIALLLLGGCLKHVMQQGNVIKPELARQIQVGDSRFRVQRLLGTVVLHDSLHPHHAIYVDDYYNPNTGKKYRRRVDIVYDDAWRVKNVRLTGFDTPRKEEQ